MKDAQQMIFIIGVVTVVTAAILVSLLRLRAAADTSLGWMSEQWLAEYRNSHPQ